MLLRSVHLLRITMHRYGASNGICGTGSINNESHPRFTISYQPKPTHRVRANNQHYVIQLDLTISSIPTCCSCLSPLGRYLIDDPGPDITVHDINAEIVWGVVGDVHALIVMFSLSAASTDDETAIRTLQEAAYM